MKTTYFWQPVAKIRHVIPGSRLDYDVPLTVRALCGTEIELTSYQSPPDMAWIVGKEECDQCKRGALALPG